MQPAALTSNDGSEGGRNLGRRGHDRRREVHDPAGITELIHQFEANNPNVAAGDTGQTLCVLAEETLGASHEIRRH